MDEQKRLFIAIILSIVVIVGWNLFFVDTTPVPVQQDQQPALSEQPATGATSGTPIADYTPGSQARTDATEVAAASIPARDARTISVSNQFYNIVISENGANGESFTLHNFREDVEADSPLKEMVSPDLGTGLFDFELEGDSIPGLDSAVFSPWVRKASPLHGPPPTGLSLKRCSPFPQTATLSDLILFSKTDPACH